MSLRDDRVPVAQLIAFGMGGFIPIALFNIVGQLVPLLGNITLGLSAFWLGTIMIIPRLSEAIVDPIVGHMSDNTRGRWGRRRPFILIGGLAVATSLIFIWWVPTGAGVYPVLQLTYILIALMIFFTACNVFEIPHGALGLEMSADPHERTRLFSAKSFLGNLFAMGTPWLIWLADLELFKGTGGTLVDGMRFVSIAIAGVLVPMTVWWFLALKEPGYVLAREQKKSTFWHDMRETISNRTFVILTLAIFTLAMGFNFVSNLANYITIFFLYGGDVGSAKVVMGINGTVWAVTALIAVFPLNWISRRTGKRNALLIAILLMCAAQISKIFCYRPGELFTVRLPQFVVGIREWLVGVSEPMFTFQGPYLILIPTMLLSAGMLMFFTLGPSMVGDVCDEDELASGNRSEGMYFSVFWWFIKMGGAFASLVGGALLLFTAFDERQNVLSDGLMSTLAVIKADSEKWAENSTPHADRVKDLNKNLDSLASTARSLQDHMAARAEELDDPAQADHLSKLMKVNASIESRAAEMRDDSGSLVSAPEFLIRESDALLQEAVRLKQQTPRTLFRLRLVEIGVPLALSCITILLTLSYPLTDERSFEIKTLLEKRRAGLAN